MTGVGPLAAFHGVGPLRESWSLLDEDVFEWSVRALEDGADVAEVELCSVSIGRIDGR